MKPLIILSVIVLLCSFQGVTTEDTNPLQVGVQLKVAAYNVEYSKNATPEEIGLALHPYGFDIVCFSEAPGGDWTKTVGGVMGLDHVVVGKYSTAGHEDKYKTIASRTPLYGYVEVLMADTLHTATKAKTRIDGIEFSIYSVHFPFGWRDQAHIDETTGKITAFVDHLRAKQDSEIPVVMGDFNFVPSSPEKKSMYYEMFLDIGLDVTWKALGIDFRERNTYNALKPEDEGSGEVIDHIMYDPQKMKVVDGGIIEMKKPLSDHKPVWALLKLTK